MLPIIQIGSLAIQTSSLLILLGFYLGISLAEKFIPKESHVKQHLFNIVILSAFSGFLGARIAFIFQNLAIISRSPRDLLSLDPSLLDPISGVIFFMLVLSFLLYRKKINFWIFLDSITPGLAVISVTLGLAHLASGAAFGTQSSLPWSIYLWGAWRHPTQLYETIAAIIIFAGFWRSFSVKGSPGQLFLRFFSASSCAYLFIDAWRDNSSVIFSGIRWTQMIAWFFVALCFLLIEMRERKRTDSIDAQE